VLMRSVGQNRVYIHAVYDRIVGNFTAENTIYHIYFMVLANPTYIHCVYMVLTNPTNA
jgi:hypothetical protein